MQSLAHHLDVESLRSHTSCCNHVLLLNLFIWIQSQSMEGGRGQALGLAQGIVLCCCIPTWCFNSVSGLLLLVRLESPVVHIALYDWKDGLCPHLQPCVCWATVKSNQHFAYNFIVLFSSSWIWFLTLSLWQQMIFQGHKGRTNHCPGVSYCAVSLHGTRGYSARPASSLKGNFLLPW